MITFSESQILIQHNLLDPLRPIHPMDIHEMRLLRLAAHAIALLNLYEKIENSTADNIAIIVGSYGSAKQQCPQLFINSNPIQQLIYSTLTHTLINNLQRNKIFQHKTPMSLQFEVHYPGPPI